MTSAPSFPRDHQRAELERMRRLAAMGVAELARALVEGPQLLTLRQPRPKSRAPYCSLFPRVYSIATTREALGVAAAGLVMVDETSARLVFNIVYGRLGEPLRLRCEVFDKGVRAVHAATRFRELVMRRLAHRYEVHP